VRGSFSQRGPLFFWSSRPALDSLRRRARPARLGFARFGASAPGRSWAGVRTRMPSTDHRKFGHVSGGPFWRRLCCSVLTDRCGYGRRSRRVCAKNSSPATRPYMRFPVLLEERWLTVGEVAPHLGVHRGTIHKGIGPQKPGAAAGTALNPALLRMPTRSKTMGVRVAYEPLRSVLTSASKRFIFASRLGEMLCASCRALGTCPRRFFLYPTGHVFLLP